MVARGLVQAAQEPIPSGDGAAAANAHAYTSAEVDELVEWGKGGH
ncbi:hypothetical protein [Xylanimonas ulmi]|nr:hypothetical protein [Xylanibacterium ulmi]